MAKSIAAQSDIPANPAALTVEQLARLLSAGGGRAVSVETVQADIDAGAPVNPDGTIHLVHFTAWLAKRSTKQSKGEQSDGA